MYTCCLVVCLDHRICFAVCRERVLGMRVEKLQAYASFQSKSAYQQLLQIAANCIFAIFNMCKCVQARLAYQLSSETSTLASMSGLVSCWGCAVWASAATPLPVTRSHIAYALAARLSETGHCTTRTAGVADIVEFQVVLKEVSPRRVTQLSLEVL